MLNQEWKLMMELQHYQGFWYTAVTASVIDLPAAILIVAPFQLVRLQLIKQLIDQQQILET